MLQKVKIMLFVLLAICTLIVVLQNTEAVETRLLFVKMSMPRAALLFGALLVGFVAGLLGAGWIRSRKTIEGQP